MSLDVLLEPIPVPTIRPCKLGTAVTELAEPYKAALENLIAVRYQDGGLTDAGLHQRLTQAGFNISISVIHYHRRGICSCKKGMVG